MPILNHGKIILIGVLLSVGLMADVRVQVDKVALYSGDSVTFTLHAEGNDIQFPPIRAIEEFPIIGTSDASSIKIINGDTTRSLSRSYTFSPSHDVSIPSFTINIAGKAYQTEPQAIKVLTPKASSEGEPFVVTLKANQQSAFVGEPITLSLIFKQKVGAKADKVEVSELELKDFWVKKNEQIHQEVEGDYVCQCYDYVLFPKKEGDITIPAIFAKVSTAVKDNLGSGMVMNKFFNDPFFIPMQYSSHKLFSNPITLHVKPLPHNLHLYGDFSIEVTVDKTELEANKPLNVVISIKGSGTIDAIPKFNPTIDSVSLYADEPKIEASLQEGVYQGKFTEHLALVADKDFVIPSFKLSYFDAKTKQAITKESKPIPIKVKGVVSNPAPQLEKMASKEPVSKPDAPTAVSSGFSFNPSLLYSIIIGMIFMGGALGIWRRYRTRVQSAEELLWARIVRAKSDKALFDILLPYAKKDKIFAEILAVLEANIYANAHHVVDKNSLKLWLRENVI